MFGALLLWQRDLDTLVTDLNWDTIWCNVLTTSTKFDPSTDTFYAGTQDLLHTLSGLYDEADQWKNMQ